MLRDLKLNVFYPYSPERVWQVITNRNALAAWLMDNDFEPRVGLETRMLEPVKQEMLFHRGYERIENFDSVTLNFYISGGWHSALNSGLKKMLSTIPEEVASRP